MKNTHSFRYILILTFSLLLTSCLGLEDVTPPQELRAPDLNIYVKHHGKSVELNYSVFEIVDLQFAERYFYVSKDPQSKERTVIEFPTQSTVVVSFTPEGYDVVYYACAVLSNGKSEVLSDWEKIKVGPLDDYVSFDNPSVVLGNKSATISIKYNALNGVNVTEAGVCYSTISNPTINDSKVVCSGNTQITLTELQGNTLYHYREYIRDGEYVAYGKDKTFTAYEAPAVNTKEAVKSQDEGLSYILYGDISADGGSDVMERGFYWGKATDSNPLANKVTSDLGIGLGGYQFVLSSLQPNTVYSYQAYAVNAYGTSFGDIKTFVTGKTSPVIGSLEVIFSGPESIKYRFAIISDGGCEISEAGIYVKNVHSSTEWKVIGDIQDHEVQITLSSSDTHFEPGAEYQVFAYSVNEVGEERHVTSSVDTITIPRSEDGKSEGFGSSDYEW